MKQVFRWVDSVSRGAAADVRNRETVAGLSRGLRVLEAFNEGRAQMTAKAAFPPGDAREDWTIIRALSPLVGHTLPYDTINVLRAAMYLHAPALAALDRVETAPADVIAVLASGKGAVKDEPFHAAVRDFYLTNPIARASAVMAEMSALKKAAGKQAGLAAAE